MIHDSFHCALLAFDTNIYTNSFISQNFKMFTDNMQINIQYAHNTVSVVALLGHNVEEPTSEPLRSETYRSIIMLKLSTSLFLSDSEVASRSTVVD